MCGKLTPAQMATAIRANSLSLAGFPEIGRALAAGLRAEIAAESHPKKRYGVFRLTEADECALETVEMSGAPRRIISPHSLPLGQPKDI